MRKILSRSLLSIFVILLFMPFSEISAKTVTVSFSGPSSVQVGDKFDVTVNYSSGSSEIIAWYFNVSSSSGLVINSGKSVDLVEATSGSLVLSVEAKSEGNHSLTINDIDSWSITDNVAVNVTGSKSINVISKATTPTTPTKPTEPVKPAEPADTRSANSDLASITVSKGTLSPAFVRSTYEYTVELPYGTDAVSVSAEPYHEKGSVSGTGEHSLEPGSNVVTLTVTAENETTDQYTITFIVEEKPLDKVTVDGKTLEIARELDDVSISGFELSTGTVDGKEQTILTNGTLNLVYLLDNEGNGGFYLVDAEGVIGKRFIPLEFNGVQYMVVDLTQEQEERSGMTLSTELIQGQEVPAWTFEEGDLSHLRLVYLSDLAGAESYYLYDTTQEVLVKFMDATVVSGLEPETLPEDKPGEAWYQNINSDVLLVVLGGFLIVGVVGGVYFIKKKQNEKGSEI